MLVINKKLLNQLFLMIIMSWYVVPIVSATLGTRPFVFTFLLWILTCNLKSLARSTRSLLYFVLWFGYMLLILIIGQYSGVEAVYFFTMTAIFAAPCIIFHYYSIELDERFIRQTSRLAILMYLVAAINTIIVLLQYPMAAKIMAMSGAEGAGKEIYAGMGCGGYNYVYGFTIFFIVLISSFKKKNKIWNIIALTSLLTNLYVIILSQYTIALLLCIISVIVYVSYNAINAGTLNRFIGALLIATTVVSIMFLPSIFLQLSSIFREEVGLSDRLLEVSNYFASGAEGYNLGSRVRMYEISWITFTMYPLFGSQLSGGGLVGGHSSLLDQLARFGIFGTIGYLLFCLANFRFASRRTKKGLILSAYITFAALSFLNSSIYVYPVGFALFFLVPIISLNLENPQKYICEKW